MTKNPSHKTLSRNLKAADAFRQDQVVKQQRIHAERTNQGLKQTDLVAFNHQAEKSAVKFLTDYIREKGAPSFNTACNLIALELDICTETAKRYIRKYSVDHPKAPFSIEDGYVKLRRTR
jgi:hypothetical protein